MLRHFHQRPCPLDRTRSRARHGRTGSSMPCWTGGARSGSRMRNDGCRTRAASGSLLLSARMGWPTPTGARSTVSRCISTAFPTRLGDCTKPRRLVAPSALGSRGGASAGVGRRTRPAFPFADPCVSHIHIERCLLELTLLVLDGIEATETPPSPHRSGGAAH
jgi:hypothetical protein